MTRGRGSRMSEKPRVYVDGVEILGQVQELPPGWHQVIGESGPEPVALLHCPGCASTLIGTGVGSITHHDDGSHTFTP